MFTSLLPAEVSQLWKWKIEMRGELLAFPRCPRAGFGSLHQASAHRTKGNLQRAVSLSTNPGRIIIGRKLADPKRRTRNRNLRGREKATRVQHELYRTENRQCAERRQVEVASFNVPWRSEWVEGGTRGWWPMTICRPTDSEAQGA